jgi:hypothetical protein
MIRLFEAILKGGMDVKLVVLDGNMGSRQYVSPLTSLFFRIYGPKVSTYTSLEN